MEKNISENNKNNNMAEKYEVKGRSVKCPACRISRALKEFLDKYKGV